MSSPFFSSLSCLSSSSPLLRPSSCRRHHHHMVTTVAIYACVDAAARLRAWPVWPAWPLWEGWPAPCGQRLCPLVSFPLSSCLFLDTHPSSGALVSTAAAAAAAIEAAVAVAPPPPSLASPEPPKGASWNLQTCIRSDIMSMHVCHCCVAAGYTEWSQAHGLWYHTLRYETGTLKLANKLANH